MTDVVGRGVIEVSADASKLKAGIDDAKRSIKSFGKDVSDSVGTASARASKSIDNYVKSLQTAAATNGRSTREVELYKLALRGASEAQLGAANNALRLNEAYEQGVVLGNQLKTGFIALAAAAGTAAVAAAAGTVALINQVGQYQDLADKIGDTAVNISSLKTAADVAGTSIETIASASVKLTASLSKTDDESKGVGEAIENLGLDFQKFKAMSPVEQLEAVAKAMDGFADGSEKTATAVAIFGKSGAELLGFLKEYAVEGTKAAYITEEQAKAADEFSDSNARLQSQLHQFLQVAAVNAIPILNDLGDLFKSIAKDEDFASTATDILKGALNGAVIIFQTVAVLASDLGFVLQTAGRMAGAFGAQLVALANLDFAGFSAISDAVDEDIARSRKSLDKFQEQVMSIGKGTIAAGPTVDFDDSAARAQGKPTIKPPKPRSTGGGGRKDNSAAQEAKAQLAFDLDEIRKSQDAITNTIANGEKVLQAERAANLVSEKEYYAQKRKFLIENDAAQEAATQKEIERLQAEKLAGKDKIDNDRKIADAQAKLSKIRENSSTSLKVLAIQEKDALDSITRAYEDARQAAQSYLDVQNRARQSEVDGMGAGSKARDFNSAINQITEKYEQQRQDLQRDNRNGKFAGRPEDYQRELDLLNEFQAKSIASYSRYYDQLNEKQKSFSLGAQEALRNYYDESQNVFEQVEGAVTNAFDGMEDALVDFVKTGKLDFKSLADSIIADFARIAIKQSITGPLAKMFADALGGAGGASASGGGTDLIGSLIAGLGSRAIGGPVSANGMYRVNEKGPELLSVAGKQYLMTGSQGGTVTPTAGGASAGPAPITVYYQAQPGENRNTASQNGKALADQLAGAQRRNS